MLSEQTIHYLSLFLSFSVKLGLAPYRWDQKTARLICGVSKKHAAFYTALVLYCTLESLYVTLVVFDSVLVKPNLPFGIVIKISIYWFSRLACLLITFSILVRSEEYANFYNKLLEVHRKLLSNG